MNPAERPRIRAVLFDFGGVLTESPGGMVRTLAEAGGADPAELAGMLLGPYAEQTDHPWHRLERGEIPFAELCAWAKEQGALRGWRIDLEPLPRLMGSLALRPEIVARADALRRQGYATALVTNNVREFGDGWRGRLAFDELFDVVVDSSEVGLRKPDERIYRLALARLGGVPPEAAVLLDDFEVNVRGAEAIGIRGVLVGENGSAALQRLDEILAFRDSGDRGTG